MAEFTLPKNSKIRPGKKIDAAGKDAGRAKTFAIYRYDPDTGENPSLDEFTIDLDNCGPMVLDAMIHIKDDVDSSLAFRRSCREGICGSCAMNIGGRNRLACLEPIANHAGDIKITPLPHMPVVKDLVPDLRLIYAQYQSIKPYMQTQSPAPASSERLQSPEDREKLDDLRQCFFHVLKVLDGPSRLALCHCGDPLVHGFVPGLFLTVDLYYL